MKDQQSDGTQSIRRAISILRAVVDYNDQGASLSHIARKLDLHVATVRRILSVLVKEDLLMHDPITKLYHLGPEIYSLGNTYQYSVIKNGYRLTLEHISEKSGDTVYLTVRSGNDILCIDRVEGNYFVRIIWDIGMRIPIGLGASGLAMLASFPEDEVESILSANQLRYANHNNMSVEKVRNLVKFARKLGYSLNEGNYQKGVTGVGVPIYNNQKEPIGAVTVASISDRMDRSRCEEIALLIKSEIGLVKDLRD